MPTIHRFIPLDIQSQHKIETCEHTHTHIHIFKYSQFQPSIMQYKDGNHYPMQILMKCCESPDKGAPPQSINRSWPPSAVRICLKTMVSHINFSNPQAPSQLPFTAASRRLYAKWKRFFTRPPFCSTYIEYRKW